MEKYFFKNVAYSELDKQKRQKLSIAIPLRMPLTLFVDPTNYCNFKCSFCARSFNDYKKFIGK